MDQRNPTQPAPVEFVDIHDSCVAETRSPIPNPRFLPLHRASDWLLEPNIRARLGSLKDVDGTDLDNLVVYAQQNAKVFLTLVFSQTLKCVRPLWEAGFTDKHLPVARGPHWEIFTLNGGRKHECFSRGKWTHARKETFTIKQWVFLAPILSKDRFSYSLHADQPLPFVPSEAVSSDRGNFGLVSKIMIPAGHHDFIQGASTRDYEIAVKQLKNEGADDKMEKFYEKEKKTLELMRRLDHPHLIRAFAAYKRGKDRGFLFPWAENGNLRQFWTTNRFPLDGELLSWAMQQMRGLTDGIQRLHDENTRHGDIKPGNVLVFPSGTNRWGTLVLADVGLAKFHALYTRERFTPTTTAHGTRRYEPPEVQPGEDGVISRKYDVWALGCVFLEFLIWLLNGPDGFTLFYTASSGNGGTEKRFWEPTSDGPSLYPVIRDYMTEISRTLDGIPGNAALKGILTIIQTKLLVVDVGLRATPSDVLERLESIKDRIPSQPITCKPIQRKFYPQLEELSRDLDLSNENQRTSKLCNPWKFVTDNELARTILSKLRWRTSSPFVRPSTMCQYCKNIDFSSKLSGSRSAPYTLAYAQIGLPKLPSTNSRRFQLLREWIRLCDETHQCSQRLESSASLVKMPTRVIDVGLERDKCVRLCEPSENWEGRYIALSHCWGNFSKDVNFCTMRRNISAFRDHISFNMLPKTFQDAVAVTRALCVRYLWIDSLCIIQDDDADWDAESKRMEDVYSSAYITIAATSSPSSLDGFLDKRHPRQWVTTATSRGHCCLTESIDNFQTDVESSILNTRAWVLQERVLSRRTIHFASAQMYWECGNGVHCESLAQLRNPRSQFLGDHDFPRSALAYFKNERIQLIQYLYTTFSKLQVTKQTDRSVAILGLQERIGRTLETRVDYGIVERYLHRSMLWCAGIAGTLSPIQYPVDRPVPSWSWMAYSGEIGYLEIPFGKVEWTSDLESPFTGSFETSFRERGIVVVARKVPIQAPDFFSDMTLDTEVKDDFKGGKWLYITLGKHTTANRLGEIRHYVLLIRPAPDEDNHGTYQRAGVGVLDTPPLSSDVIRVTLR
ncbi:hypothetical protein F5Y10DRAFT_280061 [Nemania abortiva]|nr:hypothetical protein F5Y10DRAFT_280061 [Nemania abortiva]